MTGAAKARLRNKMTAHGTTAATLFGLLGFGCGLPYPLIGATLSLWFASMKLSLGVVAALSWILFPYSLKPLWATWIDTVQLRVPGRVMSPVVSWIVWSEVLLILLLVAIGIAMSLEAVVPVVFLAVTAAFCGASQDCAVDALRIAHERNGVAIDGYLLSGYQFGYRLALFVSDGIIFIVIHQLGWSISYSLTALLMIAPVVIVVRYSRISSDGCACKESSKPKIDVSDGDNKYEIRSLLKRVSAPVWFILILYRLPDAAVYPILNLSYIESGLTPADIAFLHSAVVLPVSIIGLGVSAVLLRKTGLIRTMLIGGYVQAAGYIGLGAVTLASGGIVWFAACNVLTALAASISGVALVLYIATFVDIKKAAHQYSILVSVYSVSGKVVGGLSGFIIMFANDGVGVKCGEGLFIILLAALGCLILPFVRYHDSAKDLKLHTE